MESNEAQYLFTESELNELIADERAAEREACARVADLVAKEVDDTNGVATYIGKAIRARGQQ